MVLNRPALDPGLRGSSCKALSKSFRPSDGWPLKISMVPLREIAAAHCGLTARADEAFPDLVRVPGKLRDKSCGGLHFRQPSAITSAIFMPIRNRMIRSGGCSPS